MDMDQKLRVVELISEFPYVVKQAQSNIPAGGSTNYDEFVEVYNKLLVELARKVLMSV